MPRITTLKEFLKSHDGVTTYAVCTEALGGETTVADTITTAFYHITNYDKIAAVWAFSSVSSGAVLTVKMSQGTDTDGSGSATISGKSTTYTSTQITDVWACMLEVDADDLTDGYDYVGVQVSTNDGDGTETGAMILMPGNPRYQQATMPA